eukprot:GHUV01041784.1.p1 GENE.GHUV01041784.1~~GHUV01041784.1.p1  ORF type:complete len:161 (+),score=3.74 GHUV01041784.1:158-640(+)
MKTKDSSRPSSHHHSRAHQRLKQLLAIVQAHIACTVRGFLAFLLGQSLHVRWLDALAKLIRLPEGTHRTCPFPSGLAPHHLLPIDVTGFVVRKAPLLHVCYQLQVGEDAVDAKSIELCFALAAAGVCEPLLQLYANDTARLWVIDPLPAKVEATQCFKEG